MDHYRIDPRLGTDDDFTHLINETRKRGMRVVLDGVFNHVSNHHPLVQERPDMIRWEGGRPRGWEGHGDLVELNHDHPEVRAMVADIMAHWLRKGAAGWRLDVAYAVAADFWRDVLGRVRAEFPDAIILGEVIHGDYSRIVADAGFDTVTQYELWKAVWSSMVDVNAWELAHAVERHAQFAQTFIPNTFVGNHDVTRLASAVGPERAALAPYLLAALPGSPSIYYGDEQGFTGIKTDTWGGDDDVRPPLPASPQDLSPLGADILRHHQTAMGFRRRHPWLATAAVEVLHKSNDTLTLRCHAQGQEVFVDVDLATPAIRLRAAGETVGVNA